MSSFQRPKGTRDFVYEEAAVRRQVIERLRRNFLQFGFSDLDTPSFESIELLQCKSGSEVEEQIYSFEDKGGRKVGLIFEFTASLGRIAATQPDLLRPFKRFQIGKVWRYESPQSNRYREFYQADVDIVGPYTMDCEAEILSLVAHVLRGFGLNDFQFLVNHRKVLRAQLQVAGIASEHDQGAVLRGLDKLDKIGPEGVREYIAAQGVGAEPYERFMALLPPEGPIREMLTWLEARIGDCPLGREALTELNELATYAEACGLLAHLRLTPTLVRGLDYYTGPIFEVRSPALQNTSFGGGGRYDTLVETFGGQAAGAVGFAFGVERLITVLTQSGLVSGRKSEARVMLALRDRSLTPAALGLAAELRAQGLAVYQFVGPTKLGKQFAFASRMGFEAVVVVAEEELQSGVFKVKDLASGTEVSVARAELGAHLLQALPAAP